MPGYPRGMGAKDGTPCDPLANSYVVRADQIFSYMPRETPSEIRCRLFPVSTGSPWHPDVVMSHRTQGMQVARKLRIRVAKILWIAAISCT